MSSFASLQGADHSIRETDKNVLPFCLLCSIQGISHILEVESYSQLPCLCPTSQTVTFCLTLAPNQIVKLKSPNFPGKGLTEASGKNSGKI